MALVFIMSPERTLQAYRDGELIGIIKPDEEHPTPAYYFLSINDEPGPTLDSIKAVQEWLATDAPSIVP